MAIAAVTATAVTAQLKNRLDCTCDDEQLSD